ncbi:hypothetical protein IQ16_01932 [Bradyrhizobium huanghuaihaiense]|uniref:Uncharacterized protein n=1 Tax=Bradyrhizobium huanghuaihaiense TaxID=990078 RepID=A0A562RXT0_9BRAD|nr:hypothetical protein [Bradyrhizobium huanghuaihaiense]TWI73788.1 hypothetical protein IQ16_01932 [Bradyrhizobium huanghuaihaiense]
MGDLLSLRELAKAYGKDASGLGRKLKKLGISRKSDDKFDKEEVDAALRPKIGANVDMPSTSTRKSTTGLHPSAAPIATPEDAQRAVSLIKQILEQEGSAASVVDLNVARTAETILRARERHLRIEVASGRLVDGKTIEAEIFNIARQDRDAWLNWPAQVGPLLASELGIPEIPKVIITLEKHVRELLRQRSREAFEKAASAGLDRARSSTKWSDLNG